MVYLHTFTGGGCPLESARMLKSETTRYRGAIACPRCHDWLRGVEMTFALVPWRGDSRYSIDDAIATYASEKRAEAHASRLYEADNASPYVVRSFVA